MSAEWGIVKSHHCDFLIFNLSCQASAYLSAVSECKGSRHKKKRAECVSEQNTRPQSSDIVALVTRLELYRAVNNEGQHDHHKYCDRRRPYRISKCCDYYSYEFPRAACAQRHFLPSYVKRSVITRMTSENYRKPFIYNRHLPLHSGYSHTNTEYDNEYVINNYADNAYERADSCCL